jgi:pimeloyl-ACP methyl ester carboxylesterase
MVTKGPAGAVRRAKVSGEWMNGWRLGKRETTSMGEVAYDVFGEGPPVVLVHGTPTRSYLWRGVVPTLADRNRVYVYDLLGFGESERREGQDLSIAAQARMLKELVEAWGLERPAAVGHDIGGGIVLRAYLLEGVRFRRIALVDSAVVTPWMPESNEHLEAHMDAYRTMPNHLFEAIVAADLREATSPEMDEEAWDAYLSQWHGEEGKRAFLSKEEGLLERDTAELEPRLGEVDVPVLVVWGEEDAWLDPSQADRLGEVIPNARVRKLPEIGHFVPEDAPEELAWELSAFLRQGEGGP